MRSFEAQLHQASANIGVAIANQLPQITLTGQLGQTSGGFANMFTPTTGIWTLGFSIAQTLLDGGKLEHTAGGDRRVRIRRRPSIAARCCRPSRSGERPPCAAVRCRYACRHGCGRAGRGAEPELSRQQYPARRHHLPAAAQCAAELPGRRCSTAFRRRRRATATPRPCSRLGGGWWNRHDVDPKSKGQPGGILNIPPVQEIKLPRAGH